MTCAPPCLRTTPQRKSGTSPRPGRFRQPANDCDRSTGTEPPMTLFAVTPKPDPAGTEGKGAFEQPGVNEHGAFMNKLADEGFVLFAGPLAGSEHDRIRVLLIRRRVKPTCINVLRPTPGRDPATRDDDGRAVDSSRRRKPASALPPRRRETRAALRNLASAWRTSRPASGGSRLAWALVRPRGRRRLGGGRQCRRVGCRRRRSASLPGSRVRCGRRGCRPRPGEGATW